MRHEFSTYHRVKSMIEYQTVGRMVGEFQHSIFDPGLNPIVEFAFRRRLPRMREVLSSHFRLERRTAMRQRRLDRESP